MRKTLTFATRIGRFRLAWVVHRADRRADGLHDVMKVRNDMRVVRCGMVQQLVEMREALAMVDSEMDLTAELFSESVSVVHWGTHASTWCRVGVLKQRFENESDMRNGRWRVYATHEAMQTALLALEVEGWLQWTVYELGGSCPEDAKAALGVALCKVRWFRSWYDRFAWGGSEEYVQYGLTLEAYE